jgi:hypothetical protein
VDDDFFSIKLFFSNDISSSYYSLPKHLIFSLALELSFVIDKA